MVRRISRNASATHSQLFTVGISITEALFDPATQRLTSDLDTEEHPFDSVRAAIGTPVLLDSNINLSAIGEKWRGLAVGVANFAFVAVGESAGVGIVIADEVVRGAHGLAGNLQSLPDSTAPADRSKSANAAGIGASLTAPALRRAIKESSWSSSPPRTIAELFERAETDELAAGLIDSEARRIAQVVVSVCALLDPELVVLGGGIGSFPQLADPVRRHTANHIPRGTPIETSMLRENAALYGALAVGLREARDQLFNRSNRSAITTAI
jgi:predicted NBD/HSP70 family sugar kinase